MIWLCCSWSMWSFQNWHWFAQSHSYKLKMACFESRTGLGYGVYATRTSYNFQAAAVGLDAFTAVLHAIRVLAYEPLHWLQPVLQTADQKPYEKVAGRIFRDPLVFRANHSYLVRSCFRSQGQTAAVHGRLTHIPIQTHIVLSKAPSWLALLCCHGRSTYSARNLRQVYLNKSRYVYSRAH